MNVYPCVKFTEMYLCELKAFQTHTMFYFLFLLFVTVVRFTKNMECRRFHCFCPVREIIIIIFIALSIQNYDDFNACNLRVFLFFFFFFFKLQKCVACSIEISHL